MLAFTLLPVTSIFANDIIPVPSIVIHDSEIVHKSDFDFTGITLLDGDYDKYFYLEQDIDTYMHGPAAQVTSVRVVYHGINNRGNIVVGVEVMGNGWYRATLNNIPFRSFRTVGFIGNQPVRGFIEEFEFGPDIPGFYRFDMTATSHNFPFTSRSTWATFTVN